MTSEPARSPAPLPPAAPPTPEPNPQAARQLVELDDAELVFALAGELDAFWRQESSEALGVAFRAPESVILVYPSSSDVIRCGGEDVASAEIDLNALFCFDEHIAVVDVEGLVPFARELAGESAVALVLAHEWGHAVQVGAGAPTDEVIREIQADCYAGAWAAWFGAGNSQSLLPQAAQLEQAMGAYLGLRPVGRAAPVTHGSAFDRVAAFRDGLEGGAARCGTYLVQPPTLTELPRLAGDEPGIERLVDGQLPLAEVLALAPIDLSVFWSTRLDSVGAAGPLATQYLELVTTCGDEAVSAELIAGGVWWCPATNEVRVWPESLALAWEGYGDFGVAAQIGRVWAAAVAVEFGWLSAPSRPVGPAFGGLVADCLAGVWANKPIDTSPALADGLSVGIEASAGDLDEALAGILASSQLGVVGPAPAPSVFDRVTAFRRGFDAGVEACHPTS